MTDLNTTRRALLGALPATAVAVAIPTTLAAKTTNRQWMQARAKFLDVHQRVERAAEAHTQMENEQVAFAKAPTREVTYTEEGWSIQKEGMKIEAAAKDETFVLTRGNLRHATTSLKDTPEYAAFVEELAQWDANYRAQGRLRGWEAVEAEWEAAVDAKIMAWREMVDCPVNNARDMAEKVRLARMDEWPDENELNRLLDGLQADMNRVSASA